MSDAIKKDSEDGMETDSYNFGDWEISTHSKDVFELRIDYNVNPKVVESKFRFEAFFFIPVSFRITASNYTKQLFYEDLQAFIRFNPKLISLTELINPANLISPFYRIKRYCNDMIASKTFSDKSISDVIYELKMLANISKRYTSNEVITISNILHITAKKNDIESINDIQRHITQLLTDIKAFLVQYDILRQKVLIAPLPNAIKENFDYIIEYISLSFQEELINLHCRLEAEKINFTQDMIGIVDTEIRAERELRMKNRFPTVIVQGEENEQYYYRKSMLKKYVNNILYLTARPKAKPRYLQELGYAIAAGFAMLIFVLVSFLTQIYFTQFSLPFIAALVMGYVIKDRLKEWGRLFFGGGRFSFSKRRFDIKSQIIDNKIRIGFSKEYMHFIEKQDIPAEVLQTLKPSKTRTMEDEVRPRSVLYYTKEISLFPKVITHLHRRVLNPSDIIRYDIDRCLDRIEDSYTEMQWYNSNTTKIEKIKVARVYHLDLVIKFTHIDVTTGKEVSKLDKIRVIINKQGIKRLEATF